MVGKVICVANQKGGVGKTTTAINLGTSLALQGKNILLIDIDPQGNAGSGIGFGRAQVQENIYHVLVLEKDIKDIIQKTTIEKLDFIGSTIDLIGAEIELVNLPARETRLRKSLEKVKDQYDFIIIDCPPSLGLLTVNSLTAADSVLIPLQCEYYALEGLSQLLTTVKLVRGSLNPGLAIEGIVLTMFDKRNSLSHQVAKEINEHFYSKVFKVIIPRNVRLAEAPSYGKPVFFYDKSSPGAQSYLDLAQAIIHSERN
jgi:chromosome partitioning protein